MVAKIQVPIVGTTGVPKKRFTPIGSLFAFHIYEKGVTHGGVAIPETTRDKLDVPTALVIAVGPECKQVKEGDIVLIPGNILIKEFRFCGEIYCVTDEKQAIGVELKEQK